MAATIASKNMQLIAFTSSKPFELAGRTEDGK
jgi:hypothetical protein